MRHPAHLRRAVPVLLLALACLLAASAAFAGARPGGGSSYHGSSSSHGSYSSGHSSGYSGGSGGGGGGNAFAIFELLLLCIEHPILGIFLLLLVGGVFGMRLVQSGRSDWSTVSSYAAADERSASPPSPRKDLEGLRDFDAGFSVIVFEDFLSGLYAQVHAGRATGLGAFSAFLAPDAFNALAGLGQPGLAAVKTVIVGALHIVGDAPTRPSPRRRSPSPVDIEANYAETSSAGTDAAWYVRERWHLFRNASAPSRTPDKARVFACPSCGAPLEGVLAARCRYCNKEVCTGEFDWVVSRVELLERESRGPMLTAETREEGTDEPTVVDPDARQGLAALTQRDASFDWETFERRVGLVFLEFQRAWSARDLTAMRPFLSDNLFEVERYWIRAYEAQNLRNVTENARITRLDLARVTTDRFFDAVTVRLFGTSLDYTVAVATPAPHKRAEPSSSQPEPETVVCGSRSREGSYSEYWTFMRSARRTGPAREGTTCPNCGAPLAVSMAGNCTYCRAKVTQGDFDWVLSRIEQDESYAG